jgi:hypothetical protein
MKNNKMIYWTTTGIVAAVMLASACFFCFSPAAKEAFAHLGLPDWFRKELTVAKLFGGLALLIPAIPHRIKEFAYFGVGITITSAFIAHLSSGDGLLRASEPLVFLCILFVSYFYYHKLERDN